MTSTIEHNERKPITLRTLARMARLEEPFACLTCYDATTARHAFGYEPGWGLPPAVGPSTLRVEASEATTQWE